MIRTRLPPMPTLALAALVATAAAPGQERVPPAPDCIDARTLRDVHQADARTLAMRADDGTRALVALDTDCPGIASGSDVVTLGHGGWLCGAPGEAVRSAALACPIAGVRIVDAREYADAVRRAQGQIRTFEPVVVTGRDRRGFAGTTDYCVRVDILRGWQEDAQGLRVEVSPRRAGGNRYYRIETEGGCGGMLNASTLRLVSGMGLGVVCGNPGDRVVFGHSRAGAGAGAGTGVGAFAQPLMDPGLVAHGCRISRLYPIEG